MAMAMLGNRCLVFFCRVFPGIFMENSIFYTILRNSLENFVTHKDRKNIVSFSGLGVIKAD